MLSVVSNNRRLFLKRVSKSKKSHQMNLILLTRKLMNISNKSIIQTTMVLSLHQRVTRMNGKSFNLEEWDKLDLRRNKLMDKILIWRMKRKNYNKEKQTKDRICHLMSDLKSCRTKLVVSKETMINSNKWLLRRVIKLLNL